MDVVIGGCCIGDAGFVSEAVTGHGAVADCAYGYMKENDKEMLLNL